jgi:DNA-binding XRE family transcriptional regulator
MRFAHSTVQLGLKTSTKIGEAYSTVRLGTSTKICYNICIFFEEVIMKRQNVLYPKAAKALKALGENLRLARRRRKITASMMAERANMSVMTLRSLERGSPHVSMCNYMAVIACLGFQDDIAAVASNDILGRDLQDAAL